MLGAAIIYMQKASGETTALILSRLSFMAAKPQAMAPSSRRPLNGTGVLRISGESLKIGTWNVRTMYEAGKLGNVIVEMRRLGVKILGLSETRWTGSGVCHSDGMKLYYSGNDNDRHQQGVGILVDDETSKCVQNFIPFSERMMLLQMKGQPINVNLIQAYAPTAESEDSEIDAFYCLLNEALKVTKKHELNIVMGDFNAKVGKGSSGFSVGEFGLGVRNERGDRLVQFCQEEDFIITNTCFKLPPRRLYTWRSPQDKNDNIVRNQIDYVLINRRFRSSVKSTRTYPGADVASDHNPVISEIKIRLKKIRKAQKTRKINLDRLKDLDSKEKLKSEINNRISGQLNVESSNVDEAWNLIKSNLLEPSVEILGHNKLDLKKNWMTEEIILLMEQRRKFKNRSEERYRELNTEIKKKIREAKEDWMEEKCKEIESLQEKHDDFNLHKRIREVTGQLKRNSFGLLRNSKGDIIMDESEKIGTWTEYINTLFSDDRENVGIDDSGLYGPSILKSEVEKAISNAKDGKACGPDEVPSEILKLLNSENIKLIVDLFNGIYDTGELPRQWLESTFITVPKKAKPQFCDDFRLISLISHTLKIFLKIIHNRIYSRCEESLGPTQFGFRGGLGTREALFCSKIISQRCSEHQGDLYMCFIDFEKAFDKVQHNKLRDVLERIGLDQKDIRIIVNLYWNQTASVLMGSLKSENINIERGVRQGCVLSPILFNVYSEYIFSEALSGRKEGIQINGVTVNNIRYADDTVLIADNIQDLQTLVDLVNEKGSEFGIKINIKKTKYMVIGSQDDLLVDLVLNQKLEKVEKFKYLGCWLNNQGDDEMEIKTRIEMARQSFIKMKSFLCNRSLNLELRLRMMRCYVWSVFLYGSETWTLKCGTKRKIEAFEMWIYRRMLRISWTDKIRNEEVMRRIGGICELIKTVKKRKTSYLGHIMRNSRYEILRIILEGKIIGKRKRGRRRMSWMDNIREWTGMCIEDIFRLAKDRGQFAMMVANLR